MPCAWQAIKMRKAQQPDAASPAIMPTLLLLEDDQALAELLEFLFQQEGYRVLTTDDGDDALLMAQENIPDLVILDWMTKGTSGIEVCRRLRLDHNTAHVPIIMLTARGGEDERIRGLDTGADDYITKPFSPRELIARVAAIMRRIRPALAGEPIITGAFSLNPATHKVCYLDQDIRLGPTEYRLLRFLMENSGRVLSRDQLLNGVWGINSEIEPRTVDVHIRRLRKAIALAGAPDPIRTVRGVGYTLEV